MPPLFKRVWQLIIDDLELTQLDFRFHVGKNLKAEPNKLEMEIYNISPDHVAEITKRAKAKDTAGVNVQVSAGLGGDLHLIFDGDAREVSPTQNTADRIVRLSGHDGGRAFRESRINQSFAPGASVSSVIVACARALGVGIGNANEASAAASIDGLGASFPNGIVLAGRASDQLTRVTRAAKLTWSIQNGVLQLQQRGKPLQTASVRLAFDTGLVGSPSIEVDSATATAKPKAKKPRLLKVRSLIIPGIYPGRKIVLDSAEYSGGYEVVEALYTGDTAGPEWNIDSKVRPY